MKNKSNKPINHSIWICFHRELMGQCKWFNNKKDSDQWYKYAKKKYLKSIKYVIDY